MNIEDWLTIEGAARHLGVSTRTLRRWIKAGKLEARLEPGPYGKQYVVPRSSVAGVEVIHDIGRAEREAEREAIPQILEAYLGERESAVVAELAALRAEMREAVRRLEERQEALLAEIRALRPDPVTRQDHTETADASTAPDDRS